MGAIDKTAHMFGADADTAAADCSTGEGQVHVKCAAENTGGPFQTTDVMPTFLSTMGIPLTAPVDGRAVAGRLGRSLRA